MRATHRLGAAVVALLATVLLGGCLKLDADFTVSDDDTVAGTFVFAVDKQLLALTGQDASSLTEQVQSGLETDAPTAGTISAEPYEDDDFVGATVTFSDVPLDDFNVPGAEGPGDALTITHDGDEFQVSGQLDFELGELPGGEGGPNIDELLASSEPELSIALTFPGEVTSANGSIDGCTVTWEPSLTEPTSFEATADDSGGCTESIKWWAWILIGLGVLVLIGGIVAIVRTIKKEKARRPSSQPTGPAAAASGAAATAASAEELPPESTPLTMPPPEPPTAPEPPAPPDLQAPPAPPADTGSLPDLPGPMPDADDAVESGSVPDLPDLPGPPPDTGSLPPPPPSGPAGFPPPEPKG
jgi:hypothetical protein